MPKQKFESEIEQDMWERPDPRVEIRRRVRVNGYIELAITGLTGPQADEITNKVVMGTNRTLVISTTIEEAAPIPGIRKLVDTPKAKKPVKKTGRPKLHALADRDLLAEKFFREISTANGAEVSAEDVAKNIGLPSPRSFKAVWACLKRVYPADHPLHQQFTAIERLVRDGKVWFKYSPKEVSSS